MRIRPFVSVLILIAACDQNLDSTTVKDSDEPLLTILSPERGAMQGEDAVTVVGNASDSLSGLASISINGKAVSYDEQGHFEAKVMLSPGLNQLEVAAVDSEGNVAKERRAVLYGSFSQSAVSEALALRINHSTLDVIGDRLAKYVSDMDLQSLLQRNGDPIAVDDKGCTKYDAYVDTFTAAGYDVSLTAISGGMRFEITIDDPFFEGRIHWRTLCVIPRSWSDYDIVADWIKVSGEIKVTLGHDGIFSVSFENVETETKDFDFDSGIVLDFADWIINFEKKIMKSIEGKLEEDMPEVVSEMLNGLTEPRTLSLLGTELTMLLAPSHFVFDATGGEIVLDTTIQFEGDTTAGFFSTPMSLPAAALQPSDQQVQMSLADDLLNQVFHAAWISGALNRQIDLGEDSSASLGGLIGGFRIKPLLPPVAVTNNGGDLELLLGDLIVEVLDGDSGKVVTKLAISLDMATALGVGPTGGLAIVDADSRMSFDILKDGVSGANIFSDAQIEGFVNAIGRDIDGLVISAIGEVSLPSLAGTEINKPVVASDHGYLGVNGELTVAP